MSWVMLGVLVFALGTALAVLFKRRGELAGMERAVVRHTEVARAGGAEAQLQYPEIDLSRCLGCGTCIAVCPEDNVLDLVHGQAKVVNGARCQGISACERECPVGAITITLANAKERDDVPSLTPSLEAVGTPGLFLAGEVTAHALIKTAVEHGAAVGREVARRVHQGAPSAPLPSALPARRAAVTAGAVPGESAAPGSAGTTVVSGAPDGSVERPLDLCIVGAGPAGLACSLESRRQGIHHVVLDQEVELGGTVAKYPRRKLVMTEPVDLPIYGRFKRTSYTKEDLIGLWRTVAHDQQLPIRGGVVFEGVEQGADGTFLVRTGQGRIHARHVCLAIGRRGVPRKLGVPGEDLPKVAYGLMDAHSYRGRRVLVVGGGDSAVEAALGLAEQPGNEVVLSYRKDTFFRLRSRNEERLAEAEQRGALRVMRNSRVLAIDAETVTLSTHVAGETRQETLANQDVFVMAGGVAPTELLRGSSVNFDADSQREGGEIEERGTGLTKALGAGFLMTVGALLWALWHIEYYMLPRIERPYHEQHEFLRPGMGMGLVFGVASAGLILVNLAYLLRRSPSIRFQWGSLTRWMTSHVATGILALLCGLLHGAMAPRDTLGGHALLGLFVLLVTGAIGRYFYAWIPRAANGRELELGEVKARLHGISNQWDGRDRHFGRRVRNEVMGLIHRRQWQTGFLPRVKALLAGQRELRQLLLRVELRGLREGVPRDEIRETLDLARRAHRTAIVTAHFEDLRAILSTWRYLHRWVAALMVVLVGFHIAYALIYGDYFAGGER